MRSTQNPSMIDTYTNSAAIANLLRTSTSERPPLSFCQPVGDVEGGGDDGGGNDCVDLTVHPVFDAAQGLSDYQKYELAFLLLRSLPKSSASSLLTRFISSQAYDPIGVLPPELTLQILKSLDPQSVTVLSTVSSRWRTLALDGAVWKTHAYNEGWKLSLLFESQVLRAIQEQRNLVPGTKSLLHSSPTPLELADPNVRAQRFSLRRKRAYEKRIDYTSEGDSQMVDASDFSQRRLPESKTLNQIQRMLTNADLTKIDWHEIYKQRHRLESNWRAGRYTNFQFPHPNHPEEGHTGYVYSMQYHADFLVTGSRDQSIRIWNMDTQRLIRPPLLGHTASVLCLQFDPSPGEDVLISSGSDRQIIIWRFSTGEMLQSIPDAHSDYVLNLRFTDKFLVSCSKDHLIKVWSRKPLTVLDPDLPQVSSSPNVDFSPELLAVHQESQIQGRFDSHEGPGILSIISPYAHLMTLRGHNSAVNSVQITGNQIISASGDRQIKVWDLRTGICVRTIVGHTKGVACIQADGRRIVSGSSDNSIRVFDPSTGLEVGLLSGHSDLVRTVQARFSDLPGVSDLDYERAARAADAKALSVPNIVLDGSMGERLRGGQRMELPVTIGAKLPPGGGGGPWGRIVSGSYDKTVIVWRRDREGNWVVGLTLPYATAAIRAREGGVRRAGDGGFFSSERLRQRQLPGVPVPISIPRTVRLPTTGESLTANGEPFTSAFFGGFQQQGGFSQGQALSFQQRQANNRSNWLAHSTPYERDDGHLTNPLRPAAAPGDSARQQIPTWTSENYAHTEVPAEWGERSANDGSAQLVPPIIAVGVSSLSSPHSDVLQNANPPATQTQGGATTGNTPPAIPPRSATQEGNRDSWSTRFPVGFNFPRRVRRDRRRREPNGIAPEGDMAFLSLQEMPFFRPLHTNSTVRPLHEDVDRTWIERHQLQLQQRQQQEQFLPPLLHPHLQPLPLSALAVPPNGSSSSHPTNLPNAVSSSQPIQVQVRSQMQSHSQSVHSTSTTTTTATATTTTPAVAAMNQASAPATAPVMAGPNVTADAVASFASRVFKVQFDCRRIICCSQNPIIVGWDFANGDEKILEAVRFFED